MLVLGLGLGLGLRLRLRLRLGLGLGELTLTLALALTSGMLCSDIAMASGRPDSTPLRQVRYTAIPSGMLWREMAIMVISPEKATRRLRVALTWLGLRLG